jgi:hypothetical protein
MKLILHIGMGKTGTSSIQNALRTSSTELAEQKAHYLGMWFDAIDPKFNGNLGTREFFAQNESSMHSAAEDLLRYLNQYKSKSGIETFILSNESIFGAIHRVKPFIQTLSEEIETILIVYVRNPHSWLPSAYTQWSLYHKSVQGPLKSFSEHAPELLSMYQNIATWLESFPKLTIVRAHNSSVNVIEDFSQVSGINLASLHTRVLDRSEPAEILLRAAFNSRHVGEVFPERFDNLVIRTSKGIPALDTLYRTCFEHTGVSAMIENRRDIFNYLKEKLGPEFDFSGQTEAPPLPDPDMLQKRLIDYLVEITFLQAERIGKLESQMRELKEQNQREK